MSKCLCESCQLYDKSRPIILERTGEDIGLKNQGPIADLWNELYCMYEEASIDASYYKAKYEGTWPVDDRYKVLLDLDKDNNIVNNSWK